MAIGVNMIAADLADITSDRRIAYGSLVFRQGRFLIFWEYQVKRQVKKWLWNTLKLFLIYKN